MNKADLIEALAPRLGGRAQAAAAVESIVDIVLREVADGGTVGVTGFGVFERVERAPRTGRNPRTGEAVPIAGTRSARFRPATYFKEVVADPSTLPADGLAGVRVATHEESERAGAPATVRRTEEEGEPAKGRRPAVPGSDPSGAGAAGSEAPDSDGSEPAGGSGRRRGAGGATSGTPETVRKAAPKPRADAAEKTQPAARSGGSGRVLVGGEDITQSMISAKKAQLARAKDERTAKGKKAKKDGAKKGGGGKDKAGSKKTGRSSGKGGKKAAKKG